MTVEPAAAAVATIDPLLSLLIGALGAAALTVAGGFVGAWLQSRREHARWIREQRLAAYREVIGLTEKYPYTHLLKPGEMESYLNEHRATLVKAMLVGRADTVEAAEDYYKAVLNFMLVEEIQREPTDEDPKVWTFELWENAVQEMGAARHTFIDKARMELQILR